jgi:hypothetical protein
MNTRLLAPAGLVAATLLLASCGGGGSAGDGGGGGIGGTGGTMRISMTDAPACGYDEVNVTIERIRVHQSGTAVDGDSGWHDIVVSPARRIDLLTLTNGALEELGETALPAGRYTQMRLVLADNGSLTPPPNSVVPTGGAEVALTTPSAQQSGLKLNTAIDVPEGKVADVVLDFDACKSVVKRGNSGQYNLKPVIQVIPLLADAGLRITGYVDPSIATGASVSVQFGGVPVKATVPDLTGRFVLYPVPAGTYDLVMTANGRVNAVVTGVPVVAATPTALNDAAHALLPPASAGRAVVGTLTPPTASLRALQTLTAGPSFEAAWAPVDAVSGAFALGLPIGAPVRATYVAPPAALAFTTDTAVAGRYRLDAASGGVHKTVDIDTSAAVPPVTLTFP